MKKIGEAIRAFFQPIDKILMLFCILASAYGLILLFVASQANDMLSTNPAIFTIGGMVVNRKLLIQFIAVILGIIVAFIISHIDYEIITNLWWLIVTIAVLLMMLTYFFGFDVGYTGDKAWLMIPGINVSFQPSELLKIAFIITFSLHLSRVWDDINRPLNLLLLCVHAAIPVFLVLAQKDDGTAFVFLIMFFFMLFAAGVKLRYLIIALAFFVIAFVVLWNIGFFSDYQIARFQIFWHPEDDMLGYGYQQYRARMIIGSGQLWGKGIDDSGKISLPERHNDLIFSTAGETFGFVGCVILLLILAGLMLRLLRLSRLAKNNVGSMICIGLFAVFLSQSILNVGMNLCLMPVIGVTLPFFSAGGSSTTTLFIGIGLAMSIYHHSKPKTFQEKIHRR